MKFIQVNHGMNIRKNDIICVEDIDGLTCKVVTSIGAYESIHPSWRILMLLEQPDIEEQIVQPQDTDNKVNLFGAQHFAG